jgi:hypothetical protein
MGDELRLGKYRHYKGNFYQVIDTATHSETGEEMVVYRDLKDMKLWVRPRRMFLEDVLVDGIKVPRFKYISN